MYIIFLYVCLQAHVFRYPGRSEERVGCLGSGVTGGHESLHVGAGKRTLVLWKRYEAISYGTFFCSIHAAVASNSPFTLQSSECYSQHSKNLGQLQGAVAYSFLSLQKYGRKSGKQASCPVFIHTGVP